MKSLAAKRITIKIGNYWHSPVLHVLLTEEDDVVVARCLDFTVSSHGNSVEDALVSLANAIKEYALTTFEQKIVHSLYDPAQRKYWRMFDEIEAKESMMKLKRSINKSIKDVDVDLMQNTVPEIGYA